MNLVLLLLLAGAIGGSQVEALLGIGKLSKRNGESSTIPTLDISNMDPSTSPLENFYQFVNGGWLQRNSIPPGCTEWGSLEELRERNVIILKRIVEMASQTSGDLIGDLFNSGMNEELIKKSGLDDLSDLFAGVVDIQNKQDVLSFLGTLHAEGFSDSPFFKIKPFPDARDSSHVLAHLYQGGLGLPALGYYFDDDKESVRQAYKKHIQNMFTLANVALPKTKAADVFQIELFLANAIQYSKDPNEKNNKMTYKELQSLSAINWDGYFSNLGLTSNGFGDIVIDYPPFFKSLGKALDRFKLHQVQSYLKWFILKNTYPFLPNAFQAEGFQFFNRILKGQQNPKPRWEAVLGYISSSLGDSLGKHFVEEVFPPQAKEQALNMVELLKNALKERIQTLDWMEESTKEKALEKLNKLGVKIGYPDEWEDYSDLKLSSSNSFLFNMRQINRRAKRKDLEDINKEVKKWRWNMASFEVNAYYHRNLNEVVFPAAILQPPFFFPSKGQFNVEEMAFNFGGIGSFIGHEITHGFDNQGRKYDSNGNLVDWWTERDSKNFHQRAKTIIEQFNTLTFFNKGVNGYNTQGENIADLGGVKISYIAFQNWMKQHGEPQDLHGFSPNKQFFIAYGQAFRELLTKEKALLNIVSNPHSPGIHRINQPLTNMQEFYDAFGEPDFTQGMYREKDKRVQIW